MNQFCDLHTHSVFSDGTFTPAQIIEEAVNIGLSAVALTDHNTVEGLPDFLAAAQEKEILAIPGAEFSVDLDGTELHLLGLFIAPVHFPAVREITGDYLRRKEQSNLELIEALNRANYDVDFESIRAQSPTGNINRSHIAAALKEKGYVSSPGIAFDTLLSKDGGYYREPTRPTVWEMLSFLTGIGAVPVLAHPFLNLSEEQLAEFLPRAREQGLWGMETAYTTYDDITTATAARMAEQYALLPSGGSDFHGNKKPGIHLGIGMGNLRIPARWADSLMNTAR